MEASTRHQVLNMTWSNFWSDAYCGVPAKLQDFIFVASPLNEIFGVEIAFVMVFSDACNDVSDKVVDQATYTSVLVICMQMTFLPFLPLERHCACGGGTSSYFDVHPYSYFLPWTKLIRFRSYLHLAGLAISYLTHSEWNDVDLALSYPNRTCLIFYHGIGET